MIFYKKKVGQHGPVSFLPTKFSSQTTYGLNVEEIFFSKIYTVAWSRSKVLL